MDEYTFRLGMVYRQATLRLSEESLHVIDEKGSIRRTIDLKQVRSVRTYHGLSASDPKTGPYRSEFCKLTLRKGKPVYLRNGIYQGASGKMGEFAINQSPLYDAFLARMKSRIALLSPNAMEIQGWLLASLAWWFLSLLGVVFIIIGIVAFWYDELATAIGLAAFFLPVGGGLTVFGASIGVDYWPKRRLLNSQSISSQPLNS